MREVDREHDTLEQIFQSTNGYHMHYTPMRADLKGRVAIITGAAGMIGGAVASLFATCGAHVAIWDINDKDGAAKAREINEHSGIAKYYHVDVTNVENMESAIDQVCSDYGRIDVLFANAGNNWGNRKPVTEMDEDLFDRNIDVNLIGGTIMLSRLVIPHMVAQRSGSIIFTSSICGVTGLQNQCGFVASKFAVSALTRSLALEYGKYNIRVNTIAPGSVPKPDATLNLLWSSCSFDNYEENFSDPSSIVYDIAARRPGHPMDMAGLVLYFASDDALYTTGQVVCVDGGWTAGLSGDY